MESALKSGIFSLCPLWISVSSVFQFFPFDRDVA